MKHILFLVYVAHNEAGVQTEQIEFETKTAAEKAREMIAPTRSGVSFNHRHEVNKVSRWYILPKGNISPESLFLELAKAHPMGNPQELKKTGSSFLGSA